MKKFILLFTLFICSANILIAQWQPTEGIYGGTVTSSAVSGTNIFVGTTHGIFLSNNNGISWTAVSNGVSFFYGNTIAVSGANIFAGSSNGLYLSINNGSSWTRVNNGLPIINSSYVLAINGTNIYVGTEDGVYVSTNNGTSWRAINNGTLVGRVTALAVNGTTIFAVTQLGTGIPTYALYISKDNGMSWEQTNAFNGVQVTSFAQSGTTIYAGAWGGLYSTNDNGTTWTSLGLNKKVRSLAISGTTIYAGTTEGVFLSTNNGSSWMSQNNGLTKTDIQTLTISGTTLIAGTWGSVFISTNNGNSWTESNYGLVSNDVISSVANGTKAFVGTRWGLYSSDNNGSNWIPVPNCPADFIAFDLAISGVNIATVTGSGVYLSNNNGNSCTDIFGSSNSNTNGIGAIAMNGTSIFIGTGAYGVYLSTNKGSTWKTVNNGLPRYKTITNLAISGTNVFASTINELFLSTNNGNSWTQIMNTTFYINTLLVNGTTVFVGTYDGGVLLSTDNGNTWREMNTGLTNLHINAIAINGTTIFAGEHDGVYVSYNNGENWRAANEGFRRFYNFISISTLTISGNYLLAGTDMGVFRRPLNEFISTDAKDNKDAINCTISPNPVSNILTINASNELIGNKYVIKNVLGETILSDILINNSTELSVNKMPNGIYFLQLIGTNKTIKFVKE